MDQIKKMTGEDDFDLDNILAIPQFWLALFTPTHCRYPLEPINLVAGEPTIVHSMLTSISLVTFDFKTFISMIVGFSFVPFNLQCCFFVLSMWKTLTSLSFIDL